MPLKWGKQRKRPLRRMSAAWKQSLRVLTGGWFKISLKSMRDEGTLPILLGENVGEWDWKEKKRKERGGCSGQKSTSPPHTGGICSGRREKESLCRVGERDLWVLQENNLCIVLARETSKLAGNKSLRLKGGGDPIWFHGDHCSILKRLLWERGDSRDPSVISLGVGDDLACTLNSETQ